MWITAVISSADTQIHGPHGRQTPRRFFLSLYPPADAVAVAAACDLLLPTDLITVPVISLFLIPQLIRL